MAPPVVALAIVALTVVASGVVGLVIVALRMTELGISRSFHFQAGRVVHDALTEALMFVEDRLAGDPGRTGAKHVAAAALIYGEVSKAGRRHQGQACRDHCNSEHRILHSLDIEANPQFAELPCAGVRN